MVRSGCGVHVRNSFIVEFSRGTHEEQLHEDINHVSTQSNSEGILKLYKSSPNVPQANVLSAVI